MELYFHKNKVNFVIGRGGRFTGFGVSDSSLIKKLKVRDASVDLLRKHYDRKKIDELKQTDNRLLLLEFNSANRLAFFYKNHQLHIKILSEADSEVELISKYGVDEGIRNTIENYEAMLSHDLSLHEGKKVKKIKKIIGQIEQDLSKINGAIELKSHVSGIEKLDKEFDLKIKKIKFKGEPTIWKKKEQIFNMIKSIEKARDIQQKRLNEFQTQLQNIESKNIRVEPSPNSMKKEKVILVNENKKNHETWLFGTQKILVGKDESANSYILSKIKNLDLWMHPADVPGPHVLIVNGTKSDNMDQLINYVSSMILDCYQCRFTEVVVADKKNIKRVAGKSATVSLKNHQRKKFLYIKEWGNFLSKVE